MAVNVGKFADDDVRVGVRGDGETFPDALSGGPAAARQVPGPPHEKHGVVGGDEDRTGSPATRDHAARRRGQRVGCRGGRDPLGDRSVVRLGGADRYAVAETVSRRFNSGLQPHVTLATGVTFSDALVPVPSRLASGALFSGLGSRGATAGHRR